MTAGFTKRINQLIFYIPSVSPSSLEISIVPASQNIYKI